MSNAVNFITLLNYIKNIIEEVNVWMGLIEGERGAN